MRIERKSNVHGVACCPADFKVLGDSEPAGTFEAYVAIFSTPDRPDLFGDSDIIEPGAFTQTLQEKGFPPVVWSHVWTIPPIIPAKFRQSRIATWLPDNGRPRLAAQTYVVRWPPEKPLLLLSGNKGVGKTHLACGVLHEVFERHGQRGQFWPVVDLLERYRASFDEDRATETVESVDAQLRQCAVLVLIYVRVSTDATARDGTRGRACPCRPSTSP